MGADPDSHASLPLCDCYSARGCRSSSRPVAAAAAAAAETTEAAAADVSRVVVVVWSHPIPGPWQQHTKSVRVQRDPPPPPPPPPPLDETIGRAARFCFPPACARLRVCALRDRRRSRLATAVAATAANTLQSYANRSSARQPSAVRSALFPPRPFRYTDTSSAISFLRRFPSPNASSCTLPYHRYSSNTSSVPSEYTTSVVLSLFSRFRKSNPPPPLPRPWCRIRFLSLRRQHYASERKYTWVRIPT